MPFLKFVSFKNYMTRRVLHVVSAMDRAGQEMLIMNLYRNIDRSKIQFDFLCSWHKKGDFDDEIKELGGIIYHLPKARINLSHLSNISILFNYFKFFKSHKDYSIVHFHNYHSFSVLVQVLGAKLGGVKNIIVHSHNTNAPHPRIHKMVRPLLKSFKIFRFACSEDAGKWMFGNREKRIRIIKNGIDPEEFTYSESNRNEIKRSLGLIDKKIILHVGRFNYQKNHAFLISVFEQIIKIIPNAHLLLVGRGELEEEIKNLVKNKNLTSSVSFLGVRNDIPALLSASDLFLFPSIFEGLSVALIESQASGIKILTTSNLSKETVYCDNVLKLSIQDSPQKWASAATELMKAYDHKDMRSIVKEADFDIRNTAKNLSSFYTNLV